MLQTTSSLTAANDKIDNSVFMCPRFFSFFLIGSGVRGLAARMPRFSLSFIPLFSLSVCCGWLRKEEEAMAGR